MFRIITPIGNYLSKTFPKTIASYKNVKERVNLFKNNITFPQVLKQLSPLIVLFSLAYPSFASDIKVGQDGINATSICIRGIIKNTSSFIHHNKRGCEDPELIRKRRALCIAYSSLLGQVGLRRITFFRRLLLGKSPNYELSDGVRDGSLLNRVESTAQKIVELEKDISKYSYFEFSCKLRALMVGLSFSPLSLLSFFFGKSKNNNNNNDEL